MAALERSTLLNIATPNSVKAYGIYLMLLPRPVLFKVTNCDLEHTFASSWGKPEHEIISFKSLNITLDGLIQLLGFHTIYVRKITVKHDFLSAYVEYLMSYQFKFILHTFYL